MPRIRHKNAFVSIRLDLNDYEILNNLTITLNMDKSEVIRKAIKLFQELIRIENKYGRLIFGTNNEKELILIR